MGNTISPLKLEKSQNFKDKLKKDLDALSIKKQEIEKCFEEAQNIPVNGDDDFSKCANAILKSSSLVDCNIKVGDYNDELKKILKEDQIEWDDRKNLYNEELNKWSSFEGKYAGWKYWSSDDEFWTDAKERPASGLCTADVQFDCSKEARIRGKSFPDYWLSERDGVEDGGCFGGSSDDWSGSQRGLCRRSQSSKNQLKAEYDSKKPQFQTDPRPEYNQGPYIEMSEYKSFPPINCCKNSLNLSNTSNLEASDILQQCNADIQNKKMEIEEKNQSTNKLAEKAISDLALAEKALADKEKILKEKLIEKNTNNNQYNDINSTNDKDKIMGYDKTLVYMSGSISYLVCIICVSFLIYVMFIKKEKK